MLSVMIPAPPIPRDWFDYMNFVIGVVGLALTLWAVRQATGAKRASQQTASSLRRHTAAADFESLMRMAKELHWYVEKGDMAEARLRTTDLRAELAAAVRLHEGFLKIGIAELKDKQLDLKLVADGLNLASGRLSHPEKARLLGITGAILELLAGQYGQLWSSVEREVSNG